MKSNALNIQNYIDQIQPERKASFDQLRKVILLNLPKGFKEEMSYGMIGYIIPHSIYPAGYHCDPKLPLPFASIANQKNFIAFYHMGLYAKKELLDWFVKVYSEKCKYKLDMGKSCIRFKKMEDIPFDLIGELMQKMTSDEWISIYENNIKK